MDLAAQDRTRTTVDRDATFEETVLVLHPALLRRLVLVLGDPHEAEDLAQQTLMSAYQAWSRFDGRDVRAWLYTIGLRLAFNEKRRRRRWLKALRGAPAPTAWRPEVESDLWAALSGLEPRLRAVLLLSAVDGYTQQEIGAMLGIPVGTVGSWLSRTKAQLRVILREVEP